MRNCTVSGVRETEKVSDVSFEVGSVGFELIDVSGSCAVLDGADSRSGDVVEGDDPLVMVASFICYLVGECPNPY